MSHTHKSTLREVDTKHLRKKIIDYVKTKNISSVHELLHAVKDYGTKNTIKMRVQYTSTHDKIEIRAFVTKGETKVFFIALQEAKQQQGYYCRYRFLCRLFLGNTIHSNLLKSLYYMPSSMSIHNNIAKTYENRSQIK